MLYQQSARYKVLQAFFREPNRRFQLRELSRETKIALPSAINHVKALAKDGFLEREKTGVYFAYLLKDTEKTRAYRRNDLLAGLDETGLVDEIDRKCRPNCIVLYGSAAQGADDERGDIDIFVQAERHDIQVEDYERTFNRTITLNFEPDFKRLTDEFVNGLANGITLRGYLKVR